MPSDMGVCKVCGGPALPNEDLCDRCRGLQQHLVNVVHDLEPHRHVDVTGEGPYNRIIAEAIPLLEISDDLVVIIGQQQEMVTQLNDQLADRESVIRTQQYSIEQRDALIDELKARVNALFDSLLHALAAENGARQQVEGLREQIDALLATRPMVAPDFEWETTGLLPSKERDARFENGWDIAWVYIGEDENEQDGTMRWYRPSSNGHTK